MEVIDDRTNNGTETCVAMPTIPTPSARALRLSIDERRPTPWVKLEFGCDVEDCRDETVARLVNKRGVLVEVEIAAHIRSDNNDAWCVNCVTRDFMSYAGHGLWDDDPVWAIVLNSRRRARRAYLFRERKADASCAICLARPRDAARTACGHVFCGACLEEALKRKSTCPLCRAPCTGGNRSSIDSRLERVNSTSTTDAAC